MAFDFDGSTSYLELGSGVLTAVPITMSCWFKADNVTASGTLISLCATTGTTNRFSLDAAGATANDPIQARTASFLSSANGPGGANGYLAGVWCHAAAVFATSTSRLAYARGFPGTVEATNAIPASIVRTDIGCIWSGGARTLFFPGLLAEAAIWNAALSATEISMLANGARPSEIRPGNLQLYLPLRDSTFDDLRRSVLVPTGAPFRSPDHPPIYMPRRGLRLVKAGGTIFNQAVQASCFPIATLTRNAAKPLSASTAPLGSLVRSIGKGVAAASAPTASLARNTSKPLAASSAPLGSLARSSGKGLAAASAPTATLTRNTSKRLAAATSPGASLTRVTGKPLGAASSLVASLQRAIQKPLQASTAPISSLQRMTSKVLRANTSPVASLSALKAFVVNLQAAAGAVASLSRTTGKSLQANALAAATLARSTSHGLQAITAPVASLARGIGKRLSGIAGAVASLVTQFHGGGSVTTLVAFPPYVALLKPLSYVIAPFLSYVARSQSLKYTAIAIGNNMPAAKDLPPIDAGIQKQTVAFDFGFTLPAGVILTGTPAVTITVHSGTDGSPQTRLVGGPTVGTQPILQGGSGIANAAVLAQLGNLLGGVTYLLWFSCAATNGDVKSGTTHVSGITPD